MNPFAQKTNPLYPVQLMIVQQKKHAGLHKDDKAVLPKKEISNPANELQVIVSIEAKEQRFQANVNNSFLREVSTTAAMLPGIVQKTNATSPTSDQSCFSYGTRSKTFRNQKGCNKKGHEVETPSRTTARPGSYDQQKKERSGLYWREVSCDYLRDSDVEIGNKSEARLEIAKGRRLGRKRTKSFNFGLSLDPPSRLIEDFLRRQKASGNLSLDMDMDMDELSIVPDCSQLRNLSSLSEDSETTVQNKHQSEAGSSDRKSMHSTLELELSHSSIPRERTVSFEPLRAFELPVVQQNASISIGETVHQPAIRNRGTSGLSSSAQNTDDDSSTSCSESEIRRSPRVASLARVQTKSRLADPPRLSTEMWQDGHSEVKSSLKSTQLRSSRFRSGLLLGKPTQFTKLEEEEDDPLKDADLPESFRRNKWDFISCVQWIAFISIMGGLVSSLTFHRLKDQRVWSMALWKWALLILVVFCGRLVSGWIVRMVVLCLERSFLLRKRVLYFVYGLRKGVQNCLWFTFALLAWRFIFDPKVQGETVRHRAMVPSYVTKVPYCLLIGALMWLVKIFCVKVLASSFHVSTYFDRIQESLFSQYVLETLSGPPIIEREEEETKLLEDIPGVKKARAEVPETPELTQKEAKSTVIGGISGLIMGDKSIMIETSSMLGGKSGTMEGRSGHVMGDKSGAVGVAVGGMTGKSGLLCHVSGLIGKNQPSSNDGKLGEEEDGITISGLLGRMSGLISRSQLITTESKAGQEDVITIDHLHRLNQKNISAWHMKRLINLVRHKGISTLSYAIDESAYEGQDVEIRSEWQAKAAAKKIFQNVAKPGSRCIVAADLMRFMPRKEVARAMALFEGARDTGKITKNALISFTVNAFRERRALALTLNDTKTAVKKLHRIADVITAVIIIIIWLLVLGITTSHLLMFISSQLLLVAFMFGNTCKTTFESIIFVFVLHPFDVGDRCVIDGNQVVVEEMNILSTLFVRYDGEKIWYPNSMLGTKSIINYYRTPDSGDIFNFSIHASTPVEKLDALKEKIGRYIQSKSSMWIPDYNIIVQEIEDMNRMKMQLIVNHTMDFHDILERQIRRSNLILEVKKFLAELEIHFHHLPQEVLLQVKNSPTHSIINGVISKP